MLWIVTVEWRTLGIKKVEAREAATRPVNMNTGWSHNREQQQLKMSVVLRLGETEYKSRTFSLTSENPVF